MREVLEKLCKAQLYKKSKSDFHKTSLDYLGYRISKHGMEMDLGKVRAILECEAPRTRRQLLSFLGFANFYRQFIRPSTCLPGKPCSITNLLKMGRW